MDLLSPEDRALIRAAIKDTTDTFMKTPVTIYSQITAVDRFNETRNKIKADVYQAFALKENLSNADKMITQEGSKDWNKTTLTFNLEDLIAIGMVDSVTYEHKVNTEASYFKIEDKIYQILSIRYDGPLDEKDVLLIIEGELSETKVTFNV